MFDPVVAGNYRATQVVRRNSVHCIFIACVVIGNALINGG